MVNLVNSFKIFQITNNNIEDIVTGIDSNNIVWFSQNYERIPPILNMYLYDGTQTIQFTPPSGSPDIDGNNIVWSAQDGRDYKIYLYDGTQTIQIYSTRNQISSSAIDGNNIVWSSFDGNDSEIYLYDGTQTIQLTNNSLNDDEPRIDGNNIVWMRTFGINTEIYLYDRTQTIQLTNNSVYDSYPHIDGNNIVWSSFDGNDSEIYFYDGTQTIQLTNNSVMDSGADIDGNNIVWSGFDGNDYEIYLYDGIQTIQLTNNSLNDGGPYIDGNNIVWSGFDGKDYEIYLLTLEEQKIDTSPLIIDGEFKNEDKDQDWEATGTILIGREDGISQLLKAENATAELSKENIRITGTTIYSSIGGISSPLFKGDLVIPTGKTTTSILNDNNSLPNEFKLVGLDINFNKLILASNQIELQGKFKLPEPLGSFDLSTSDSNPLVINNAGLALNKIELSDEQKFVALNLLEVKTQDAAITFDFNQKQGKIQGKFTIPTLNDASFDLTGNNYIAFKEGASALDLAMVANISVAPISIFNTWGLQNVNITVNDPFGQQSGTIKGKAQLKTPGNTIDIDLAFKDGKLTSTELETAEGTDFTLFGTDVDIRKLKLIPDSNLANNNEWEPQFELQGKITLPDELNNVSVDITGDNKLVITEEGLKLTGAVIQLPNFELAYDNLFTVAASGLTLGMSNDFFKIQGKVTGSSPFLGSAAVTADFTNNKYIKISEEGVDVVGKLSVENIILADKWGLKNAEVYVDTVGETITGKADIQLPWGVGGLGGTLSFIEGQNGWELNQAGININGNFPPLPIMPAISLQSINGKVFNLAKESQNPITFQGGVTLTAGSSLSVTLPSWAGGSFSGSAGKFTVDGEINENRLFMNGDINLFGGLLSGSVNNLAINWSNPSINANVNGTFLGGLIGISGGLNATANFDFTIWGEASGKIPDNDLPGLSGLSGKELISIGGALDFTNDENYANDSVVIWGKLFDIELLTLGARLSFDGQIEAIGYQTVDSIKQKTFQAEGSISSDSSLNINQVLPLHNLSQVLKSARSITYSYLQDFAKSSDFNNTMNLAFGNNWSKSTGSRLARTWSLGNFSTIPKIKILAAANIGGANAAFADTTNTIYLSKEYLTYNSSDLNNIAGVLLEEIGHWVDAKVNSIDSPGDEGAIFSSLVRHQSLNQQQLEQLKTEDDTLTITLNGTTTQLNLNFSQDDAFSIAPDTPWLLLAVNWENEASNVPIELISPDGKVYTEADIANSQNIFLVDELSSSTRKVVRVDKPETGVWKIKLPDAANLGKVEFSALGGLEAPQMKITTLTPEQNSSNVSINYELLNIDANAQVSLYYDDNERGFDGVLIGKLNPQTEGANKYIWNTEGIDPGQYYVYALVFDGDRIPTSAYSLKSVKVGKGDTVNNPPTIDRLIADQIVDEDSLFSFQLPANTFSDVDTGDTLTYTATLDNGNPLPSWLTFDAATRTFFGTPGNNNVGAIDVKVTATDTAGASISDTFKLTVVNVNDAPILVNAIADQQTITTQAFSLTLPADTFKDIDAGDTLTYSATLENGDALPSWLTFDATTRTFSGTPNSSNAGILNVKVTATDSQGLSVSDSFALDVLKLIPGTVNNDTLTGTNNVGDYILGREGRDILTGLSGNDLLVGGAGSDVLTGGMGKDWFVYTNFRDIGDTIKDFELGNDKIILTDLLDSLGYGGSNPLADGYVKWVQGSNGTSIQIDPDGAAGSGIFRPFITLENVAANNVNASHFVF